MKRLRTALVLACFLATSMASVANAGMQFIDLGANYTKCDGIARYDGWFNNTGKIVYVAKAWAHIRANIGATGDYSHGIFRISDDFMIAGDELDVSHLRGSGDLTRPWEWKTERKTDGGSTFPNGYVVGQVAIAPNDGIITQYWCAGYLPNPLFNLPASSTTGTFQAGLWLESN